MRYCGNGQRTGRGYGTRWNRPGRDSLYRSRKGVLLGVCSGAARYFDMPVNLMRAVVLLLFFVTGFWPVGLLYLLAAVLMRMEPSVPFGNDDEREFYNAYSSSRTGALHRMQRVFENLDRRLRRMEDVVTSKDFEWERRMRDS